MRGGRRLAFLPLKTEQFFLMSSIARRRRRGDGRGIGDGGGRLRLLAELGRQPFLLGLAEEAHIKRGQGARSRYFSNPEIPN